MLSSRPDSALKVIRTATQNIIPIESGTASAVPECPIAADQADIAEAAPESPAATQTGIRPDNPKGIGILMKVETLIRRGSVYEAVNLMSVSRLRLGTDARKRLVRLALDARKVPYRAKGLHGELPNTL